MKNFTAIMKLVHIGWRGHSMKNYTFCSGCGNIKQNTATPFCIECEEQEKAYRLVKEYLARNPRSNAMQIANATQVSIYKITKFVREGLLHKQSNIR